jgi:RNA polymerase sigma-70 factor (ECF subfamily)
MSVSGLVEHFFRHEYGRIVAVLSCRYGFEYLSDIEDAVQSALLQALQVWRTSEIPKNPSAWVLQVARNNLLGELRQHSRRRRILDAHVPDRESGMEAGTAAVSETETHLALLLMLFACCDDAIPADSQLVLALRTLCGFDPREIALRIFSSEANVYKRLERARIQLKRIKFRLVELDAGQVAARLPTVQRILYSLFTEGYLSSRDDAAIRRDLCDEAIRLAAVLATHPVGATPDTFALLAVMHFHRARLGSRQDDTGSILLLEEQDRTLWDQSDIQAGFQWLAASAEGDHFSRYHAEAGIAAEHCRAASYSDISWDRIVDGYALLERFAPSPLHRLNRAIAMAEWRGPEAGLAELDGFTPPGWLSGSYMWAAVLADLHRRCGHIEQFRQLQTTALELAPSGKIRAVLARRLAGI